MIVMEQSGMTRAPEREDAVPAGQPERQDGGSPDAQRRGAPWRRRRGQEQPAQPWRVEGMPDDKQDRQDDQRNWPRFWLILLALLIINWILTSALLGATRPTVPYTYFLGQLNANNVQTVTSTGNTIQGTFRHQVTYPPGSADARSVQQFSTERPTYADDNLFGKLRANGVTINANSPNRSTPLWEELLLWFGPALLLGGLLAWWWRKSGGSMGSLGMGGMGRSRARRYDPGSAKRTTFADVAGIEDVENEVREIVD